MVNCPPRYAICLGLWISTLKVVSMGHHCHSLLRLFFFDRSIRWFNISLCYSDISLIEVRNNLRLMALVIVENWFFICWFTWRRLPSWCICSGRLWPCVRYCPYTKLYLHATLSPKYLEQTDSSVIISTSWIFVLNQCYDGQRIDGWYLADFLDNTFLITGFVYLRLPKSCFLLISYL